VAKLFCATEHCELAGEVKLPPREQLAKPCQPAEMIKGRFTRWPNEVM
jgi:hypothetical protein